MPHLPHSPSDRRRRRMLVRLVVGMVLAGGFTLVGLNPAAAHVRVAADHAIAGTFSVLTFRVPNESDTAGTVKISATLPQDTPFVVVSSKP